MLSDELSQLIDEFSQLADKVLQLADEVSHADDDLLHLNFNVSQSVFDNIPEFALKPIAPAVHLIEALISVARNYCCVRRQTFAFVPRIISE